MEELLPRRHWFQWVEIHPLPAGRKTSLYTAFYPDRQALRLDPDTEVSLPHLNAPAQIWSQPGFDPEIPYRAYQSLHELQQLLAADSETAPSAPENTKVSETEPLAELRKRLQRLLTREQPPEIREQLQTAQAALLSAGGNPSAALSPAARRTAAAALTAAQRSQARRLPPELRCLPHRTPELPA